jgi:hypothetical protein
MTKLSPALFGATRFRVAPSIGLRGHRPWGTPRGGNPKRGALFSATIALCLTGCATTQPVRYTPVYCLSNETQLPAEPPKVHDQLTGEADKDAGILAGSAIRLRAWGQALNHILEGCREPTH